MAEQNQHREKLFNTIERYLRKEMSSEERLDFDNRLKVDENLRAELELHRDLDQTFQIAGEGEVRKKLAAVAEEWHEDKSGKKENGLWSLRKMISIAALAIVAVGLVIWLNNKPTTSMYADDFEPYQMVLSQRSVSDTAAMSKLLNNAVEAYNKKDYNRAAIGFEELSKSNKEDLTYQFYTGVANLGNKNYDQAISFLKPLAEKGGHLLQQQARWYYALALQKSGADAEARKIFQIIKPGEYNYDRIK